MHDEFEQFLQSVGLTLELRRGPEGEPFGNWMIQYGDKDLGVSMVYDRGDHSVCVADKHTLRPPGFLPPSPVEHDVNLIREMMTGVVGARMNYADQKDFVRANWNGIVAMLSPNRRETTHQQLTLLGRERFKRSFDPRPAPILEFEKFLQGKGLACKTREAPGGVLGNCLMVYEGADVNVRIDSTGGWRLLFADASGKPEAWYDLHTLRKVLPASRQSIKFREWFTLAASHWDTICAMFQPSEREITHQRLAPLEEETRKRRAEVQAQREAQMQELRKKAAGDFGSATKPSPHEPGETSS